MPGSTLSLSHVTCNCYTPHHQPSLESSCLFDHGSLSQICLLSNNGNRIYPYVLSLSREAQTVQCISEMAIRMSWQRFSALINAWMRWSIVRKVSSHKSHQARHDNKLLQTQEPSSKAEENICLICWDPVLTDENESCERPSKDEAEAIEAITTPQRNPEPNKSILQTCKIAIFETSRPRPSPFSSRRSSTSKLPNSPTPSLSTPGDQPPIIHCAKSHSYHTTCLSSWILSCGERAPRTCELCSSPYIGPAGRALTASAVQQTLAHHKVFPLPRRSGRRAQILAGALDMMDAFRRARPQFFNEKHLGEFGLTLRDVDREFLQFFGIPTEVQERSVWRRRLRRKEREMYVRDGLLDVIVDIRLFRIGIEVLEMYC
jgi:hypothetical protein